MSHHIEPIKIVRRRGAESAHHRSGTWRPPHVVEGIEASIAAKQKAWVGKMCVRCGDKRECKRLSRGKMTCTLVGEPAANMSEFVCESCDGIYKETKAARARRRRSLCRDCRRKR